MVAGGAVLVLGGTGEATELAGELTVRGHEVVISLAGTTSAPRIPNCRSRIGGFGGVEGLVAELQRNGYRLLVDATHPFAARMSHNAAAAASRARVPRLRLLRPPWRPRPGDTWYEVDDLPTAARRLTELGARRPFLAIGRGGAAAFADVPGVAVVVRSIDPPSQLPATDVTVLLSRGPFTVDSELALLVEHRIDVVVTRNSGGEATAAKLDAAGRLGIPVIMVRRPASPPGEHVDAVSGALAWVEARR